MIIAADQLAAMVLRKAQELNAREGEIVLRGRADFAEYQNSLGYLRAVKDMSDYVTYVVRTNGAIPEE